MCFSWSELNDMTHTHTETLLSFNVTQHSMLRMIHSLRATVCACLMPSLLSLTDSVCLISSESSE